MKYDKQCARIRTWENPRFWLWWCQMIFSFISQYSKFVCSFENYASTPFRLTLFFPRTKSRAMILISIISMIAMVSVISTISVDFFLSVTLKLTDCRNLKEINWSKVPEVRKQCSVVLPTNKSSFDHWLKFSNNMWSQLYVWWSNKNLDFEDRYSLLGKK